MGSVSAIEYGGIQTVPLLPVEGQHGTIEWIEAVARFAGQQLSCAVIAVGGASEEQVTPALQGLLGEENVLVLNAQGTFQGEDLTADESGVDLTLSSIEAFRANVGNAGIIVFELSSFSDEPGEGTPSIHRPILELMQRLQDSRPSSHDEPGLVFVGRGRPTDIRTHPDHLDPEHTGRPQSRQGLLGQLVTTFALFDQGDGSPKITTMLPINVLGALDDRRRYWPVDPSDDVFTEQGIEVRE